MRGRNEKLFFVVESHVNIPTPHREYWLIGVFSTALGHRHRPGSPNDDRSPHANVSFPVLQPPPVHGRPVNGIHHDLRIEFPRRQRKQRLRRLPCNSIVIADQQGNRWRRAVLAVGHGAVLRVENVNVPVAVGGYCWLPLIARGVTDAPLRREYTRGQYGLHACQKQKREQQAENSSIPRSPGTIAWRNHRTTPGERSEPACDSILTPKAASITCLGNRLR